MKYKVGDRVKYLNNDAYIGIDNEVGTIIKCKPEKNLYLVSLKKYPYGLNFETWSIKKLNWFQKLFSR